MRNIKKVLLTGLTGLSLIFTVQAQHTDAQIANGPYTPTNESLQQYQYPEWFRDAKFGMWSHWGPQAVPRQGDWYAKNMYLEGHAANKYHVAHYGHPSKFGYKDIIPLWKAERWDPEKLMKLFKKAGAKYFVSMASHHDNFFLWNSKINRWNSVNIGPKKDVVGLWQKAAKKEGLRFGVSEHLAASYNWFQTSRGTDKNGSLAGVPYDGTDPQYADLYHAKADSSDIKNWLTNNPAWHKQWLADVKELIDRYHPDLLYSDSQLPFGEVGRTMLAHYYNQDITKNSGRLDALYTCKQPSAGKWVQDVERGVLDSISPFPGKQIPQLATGITEPAKKYRSADEIAQLLVDIVSKNGNLLINVVQTPEGDLEQDVLNIVEKIGEWTAANGEGIYATRPWKIYGEGPSTIKENQKKGRFGGLSDSHVYQPADIRFTTKGNNVYAFCMAAFTEDIRITSLGKNASYSDKRIASVTMLGSQEKLQWKQEGDALVITKPATLREWKVSGYKIVFGK